MKKYVLKRILFVIPIMLILSFLTFVLTYLSPADPAALYFESRNIHPEEGQIEAMREEMGLNDPLLVRYGRWPSTCCTATWARPTSTPHR